MKSSLHHHSPWHPDAASSFVSRTWRDPDTGLVWMLKALPGNHCWADALALTYTLNSQLGFEGASGWRLPTLSEFKTIMDYEGRDFRQEVLSRITPTLSEDYHQLFWTSTTHEERPDRAWSVEFGTGRLWTWSFKDGYAKIRLVSGPAS